MRQRGMHAIGIFSFFSVFGIFSKVPVQSQPATTLLVASSLLSMLYRGNKPRCGYQNLYMARGTRDDGKGAKQARVSASVQGGVQYGTAHTITRCH